MASRRARSGDAGAGHYSWLHPLSIGRGTTPGASAGAIGACALPGHRRGPRDSRCWTRPLPAGHR
eukprot:8103425-Lingulodinium_polyedra.AAC.1